eukprot:136023_1
MAAIEEDSVDSKFAGEAGEENAAGSGSDTDRDREMEANDLVESAKMKKVKSGDYIVQVHVIEARDLKGRGVGDMSDPVTKVEVLGQKRSTQIQKSCLSCVFDQVLTFEFPKLDANELQEGKIKIDVLDANTIRRNVLIGSYELDLTHVYFSKYHEIHRAWLALSDITDKHEGIQGYLRVSVVVLGPDDEQKIWDDEEDDEEDDMLCVLMPPQIEQIGRLLKVQIFEVDDLISMDEVQFGSKCDPYFVVEFAGVKVRTKHYKGKSAKVNKQLNVPVMEPIMGSTIRFRVKDWDAASSNQLIASTTFDYNAIKADGAGASARWVSLYGAPKYKQKGKIAQKMNKGAAPGSTFRGRVLLRLEVEDEPEPKKGVSDLAGLARLPPTTAFILQMDLYEGSEIVKFALFPDMHVEVHCGEYTARSRRVKVKDGRCEWYDILGDGNLSMALPEDTSQCPDVFVYLCNKSARICYKRFKFEELLAQGWRVTPSWFMLNEDKALDKLDNDIFPGSLLFSLRLGLASTCPRHPHPDCRPFAHPSGLLRDAAVAPPAEAGGNDADLDFGRKSSNDSSELSSPAATVGKLTVTILEGKSLPAADSDGHSDPYVKLYVEEEGRKRELFRSKTKVMKRTLNPIFNHTVEVDKEISVDSVIRMKVMDHDKIGADDTLGQVSMNLRDQSDKPPGQNFDVDVWCLLNDKVPDAKLHVRFQFTFSSSEPSTPHRRLSRHRLSSHQSSGVKRFFGKIREKGELAAGALSGSEDHSTELGKPSRTGFQLRCFVYQCRNVAAADRSGLSDPYVVVRCCGKECKTKIKKATLYAEWYEILTLNVMLPEPLDKAPDILVSLLDFDKFTSDDVLGFVRVPVSTAAAMQPHPRELAPPKWMKIRNADNDLAQGELLISFQLVDAAQDNIPLPKTLVPPSKLRWLQIVTLGVRDLSSILGLNKPFLVFKLPSGKRYQTNSSRKPSARDANFLQILKIPIRIPNDRLFAPVVTINASDSIFGGLVKRHLGASALSVDMFMPGYKEARFAILEAAARDNFSELSGEEEAELNVFRDEREKARAAERKRKDAERKAKEEADRLLQEEKRRLLKAESSARLIREQTDQRMSQLPSLAESHSTGEKKKKKRLSQRSSSRMKALSSPSVHLLDEKEESPDFTATLYA